MKCLSYCYRMIPAGLDIPRAVPPRGRLSVCIPLLVRRGRARPLRERHVPVQRAYEVSERFPNGRAVEGNCGVQRAASPFSRVGGAHSDGSQSESEVGG